MGFEIVAASLRADSSNLNAFLPALAVKLSGALPQQTSVHYHGGVFSKKKTVQAIDVDLGELRFHVEEQHRRIEAASEGCAGHRLEERDAAHRRMDRRAQRLHSHAASTSEHGRLALKQLLENA